MAAPVTLPLPPPLVRQRVPVIDDTLPGEIKRDASGRLYQEWIAYENFSGSSIEAMNTWYRDILPRQVAARVLYLPNGEQVQFSDIQLLKPSMYDRERKSVPLTPQDARLLMRSYVAELRGVMRRITPNGDVLETYSNKGVPMPVLLGYLPVMLGSSLCHLANKTAEERVAMGEDRYDPFGYFIYSGGERVVISQEHQRMGRILFVNTNKKIGKTKAGRVKTAPPKAMMTLAGNNIVSMSTNDTGEIRLAVRLFNRASDKTLPLISVMRLLIEDYRSQLLQGPVDNMDDEIMGLIARMSRPSWKKKLWIHLQMSFWQSSREDLIETTWTALGLPQTKDASGGLPPQGRLRPRPLKKKRADEAASAASAAPPLVEFTLPEKKAILLEEIKLRVFPQMLDVQPSELRDLHRINLLALMTARYLEVLAGLRLPTDKDKWYNKRVETAPRCCEQLFAGLWKKVLDLVQLEIDEMSGKIPTLAELRTKLNERVHFIADEFRSSFVTASWGVKDKRNSTVLKENISEPLKRQSQLATLSHLKKINVPVPRKGKNPKLRYIDATQYGYVCVVDTPEGANCGLNKFFTVTSTVSVERNPAAVRHYLDPFIVAEPTGEAGSYVMLNGVFLGWCNGREARTLLIGLRRRGELDHDICIVYDRDDNALHVYTDGARTVRPLLIVDPADRRLVIEKKNMWNASWTDLVKSGCVEYLDPWEVATERIFVAQFISDLLPTPEQAPSALVAEQTAERQPYTHCEIDPTAVLGVSAAIIPLANHNQAPRNVFQASMGKQAVGVYHENHANRFDAEARVLSYPARPLFEPQINRLIGLTRAPPGVPITVAILAHPYNQEDAFVIKQSAVDRGLFMYTKYTPYKVVEKKVGAVSDIIKLPSTELRKRDPPSRYRHIRPDGTPELGAILGPGDCVIGKVRATLVNGQLVEKNDSVYLSKYERGIVDKVLVGMTEDNKRFVRVKIRDVRRPQVGDKLASRSAQKGTIGMVAQEEDMPYEEASGVAPDLLINPHSIPSRMTMGKVIEFITGRVAALQGQFYNATSFSLRSEGGFNTFYTQLRQELVNHGFSPTGKQTMINGITGERLDADVYVGECFYQLLKHTVQDKIQARSVGGRQRDTRQPLAGRDSEGGSAMRIGEMERDAILTSGGTALMQERLMHVSDVYTNVFCKNCGLDVVSTHNLAQLECRGCGKKGDYVQCESPYAFKHLSDLLLGAGIKMRFKMLWGESERYQPQKGTYDPQSALAAAEATYNDEEGEEGEEEEIEGEEEEIEGEEELGEEEEVEYLDED
jgi:DNA-directed RNA polymerase II subunit RPB2